MARRMIEYTSNFLMKRYMPLYGIYYAFAFMVLQKNLAAFGSVVYLPFHRSGQGFYFFCIHFAKIQEPEFE